MLKMLREQRLTLMVKFQPLSYFQEENHKKTHEEKVILKVLFKKCNKETSNFTIS